MSGEFSELKCIVCSSKMTPYFKKTFLKFGLGEVEYVRCPSCQFVCSETHYKMTDNDWCALNEAYHGEYFEIGHNPDDPRWIDRMIAQASVIASLVGVGILKSDCALDYGAGDGRLADLLDEKGIFVDKYDKFISKSGYRAYEEMQPGGYDLVISTAVFEHVRCIETLDEIVSFVSEDGVLALHTMIMEQAPRRSDWHYLVPVHCSFFSNKSMQKLFERWNFTHSFYHVESRMWFFFRNRKDMRNEFAGYWGEI
jgi:hypothetical protein